MDKPHSPNSAWTNNVVTTNTNEPTYLCASAVSIYSSYWQRGAEHKSALPTHPTKNQQKNRGCAGLHCYSYFGTF